MAAGNLDPLHVLASRASSGPGSHQSGGSSVSALLSTLIPVLLVSVVIFLVFLFFQRKQERVYGPRTFLPSLRRWQLSPTRSPGWLGWSTEFKQLRDEYTLAHSSIDNYLWLRLFKTLVIMCFGGCLITWPILFPVNATGGASGVEGLDILSFSGITPGPRYYAQVFVSWIFLAFVMALITREAHFYVRLRQLYFLSPYQTSRISSSTVLFVNVPEESRGTEQMRKAFSHVRHVWPVSVPEELAEHAAERDKAATKLDGGETKLIKNHVKRQIKREKKESKAAAKGKTATSETAAAQTEAAERGQVGTGVVDQEDRPTHRLPVAKFLPLGKKVDTIDWSRGELHRLIPEVAQEQNEHRSNASAAQSAIFVEFDSIVAAYDAVEQLASEKKAKMTAKEVGMAPEEVIWKNTIKPAWKVKVFSIASTTFVWWLCIFWTIPVAVIGAISNINYLTNLVPFLRFIDHIPSVILGVVTGLLPVILLSVLMSLVPIIMNILAKLFEPTLPSAQMKVQTWYFPFQVIQVFLVTTFASGASSVVTQIIKQPQTATTLLATNLPKASNFYIDYFVLYGLNAAAMQFLNVVPLLFVLILGSILDGTPRKMLNRYITLSGLGWGSIYPVYTNLGVIALAYSSISPLVLGFATVGFSLIYLGFRYNVLFTLGTQVSTRGASYGCALQQLTTGIYISEVCLIGLFAIGVNSSKQSIGPLVLQIVFLVGTIVWHVLMRRSLRKLNSVIPEAEITEKPRQDSDNTAAASEVEMHPGYNGNGLGGNGLGANDPVDKQEKPSIEQPKAQAQVVPDAANAGQPKQGLMGAIKDFFAPVEAASKVIAELGPHLSEPVRPYTEKERNEAYLHPALTSVCPMVWVARDKYGVSKKEVSDSTMAVGEGFEMSDEGAWFNEKGKIEWDRDNVEAMPVWQDKPVY